MKNLLKKSIALMALALTTPVLGQTLTITHDEGTTTINTNPKRVVVLDLEMLGWMYALGLGDRVVGVGNIPIESLMPNGNIKDSEINEGFLAHGKLKNPISVGSSGTPNLEKILALKPDIILRLTWPGNQNFDKLSKIAPTIGYQESSEGYWEKDLLDVARIFGVTDRAKTVINKVNKAKKINHNRLVAAGVFKKYSQVIVVAPYGCCNNRAFTKSRVIDDVKGLGFKDNPDIKINTANSMGIGGEISDESLLNINSKTLIILVPPTLVDSSADEFMKSPIGKKIANNTILYSREKYSPWTGPLVSIRNSDEITRLILNKFK